jgi:hypothetical protein
MYFLIRTTLCPDLVNDDNRERPQNRVLPPTFQERQRNGPQGISTSLITQDMEIAIWQLLCSVVFAYWVVCRSLRWKRANEIATRFSGRDPYSLTVDEAQWVVRQIARREMFKISRLSTAFALFRTYGIRSIAEILLKSSLGNVV